MLMKCPECELQVSDKAVSCPHCGFPIKGTDKPAYKKSTKHKRLPNGFGQITEIKNRNLRKPYRAMVTVGFYENGKPKQKILKPDGYFKTYNDAYQALIDYNRNPYDLDNDITIKQLYDRWLEIKKTEYKSDSSIRSITSAWAYCGSVYDMRVKDLRARHIKGCMEEGTAIVRGEEKHASPGIQSRIKSLFNMLLDYALEYELADKNYARTFDMSSEVIDAINNAKDCHISFSSKEMKILWDNANVPYVDIVLIQCYMGWRPIELGLIEVTNVDLKQNIIIGGVKTPAGIMRRVPIHSLVRPFVEKYYFQAVESGSKYLFTCTDGVTHKENTQLSYGKYQGRFGNIVTELKLNPEHRPHDGRKTYITMAKHFKMDEYAIKYIVGHRINDITESVYTDRPISWLIDETEKITKEF